METTESLITFDLPPTLEEIRNELKNAKTDFQASPTYYNSVRIQFYQQAFDLKIQEARSSFHLIDGGSGYHTVTPYEIAVSALKEIKMRSNQMGLDFNHLDYGYGDDFKPFNYIWQVCVQALSDIGE